MRCVTWALRTTLTLLVSERPKLYTFLAFLSTTGLYNFNLPEYNRLNLNHHNSLSARITFFAINSDTGWKGEVKPFAHYTCKNRGVLQLRKILIRQIFDKCEKNCRSNRHKGEGWSTANQLLKAPPPPPSNFIAGRPNAALLFWFFMVILVIYKYKKRQK